MSDAKTGTNPDDGGRYACDQSAIWITAALAWLEAAALWAKNSNAERTHAALEQATLAVCRAGPPLCERLRCREKAHGTIAEDAEEVIRVVELALRDIKEEPRH